MLFLQIVLEFEAKLTATQLIEQRKTKFAKWNRSNLTIKSILFYLLINSKLNLLLAVLLITRSKELWRNP